MKGYEASEIPFFSLKIFGEPEKKNLILHPSSNIRKSDNVIKSNFESTVFPYPKKLPHKLASSSIITIEKIQQIDPFIKNSRFLKINTTQN